MVIHTCPKCKKEFNKKSHYLQHINKKTSCQAIIQNNSNNLQNNSNNLQNNSNNLQINSNNLQINSNNLQINSNNLQNNLKKIKDESVIHNSIVSNKEDLTNIICKYCFKTFSRISNLHRHQKENRCKVIKLENEKKQTIYNNLVEDEEYRLKIDKILKENEEYKQTILLMQKKYEELNNSFNTRIAEEVKKNTQNITNNNTVVQNINITPVKLNAFGKENLKDIKYDELMKIISDSSQTGRYCFNRLIDLIHFNNKLPENQNVYMPDYNRGKFMYFNGVQWQLTQDEENVIFQVLEHVRKLFDINDNDELELKLETDHVFRKNFKATFKKYYDWVYDEDDEACMSEQDIKKKNDFKAMMSREVVNKLYNNRDLVRRNYEN